MKLLTKLWWLQGNKCVTRNTPGPITHTFKMRLIQMLSPLAWANLDDSLQNTKPSQSFDQLKLKNCDRTRYIKPTMSEDASQKSSVGEAWPLECVCDPFLAFARSILTSTLDYVTVLHGIAEPSTRCESSPRRRVECTFRMHSGQIRLRKRSEYRRPTVEFLARSDTNRTKFSPHTKSEKDERSWAREFTYK